MASGKTTTGKRIAKIAHQPFRDLDWIIEQKVGIEIPTLFQEKGETYFRRLEQFCLQETILTPPSVIATGGGTPCFYDNINWIKQQIYCQL